MATLCFVDSENIRLYESIRTIISTGINYELADPCTSQFVPFRFEELIRWSGISILIV